MRRQPDHLLLVSFALLNAFYNAGMIAELSRQYYNVPQSRSKPLCWLALLRLRLRPRPRLRLRNRLHNSLRKHAVGLRIIWMVISLIMILLIEGYQHKDISATNTRTM